MKVRLLVVALMILSGCSKSANKAESVKDKSSEKPVPQKAMYSFRYESAEKNSNSMWQGKFVFKHEFTNHVQIYGAYFTTDGVFRTASEDFFAGESNTWSRISLWNCGATPELYDFEPNKQYNMIVPLYPFPPNCTQGIVRLHGDKELLFDSEPFNPNAR